MRVMVPVGARRSYFLGYGYVYVYVYDDMIIRKARAQLTGESVAGVPRRPVLWLHVDGSIA